MAKKVDDKTLLALCLSGKSQTVIAQELKMSKSQICRRVNSPKFQDLLSEYRKKMVDGILTDLSVSAQEAVQTLVKLLQCENPFVALQAAVQILKMTQDYQIHRDLQKDIDDLKKQRNSNE